MMVIYLPVKFEFDWTNRFPESRNKNVDKQTDGQTNGQKNEQMNGRNYTNFERNLAMMVIYVPVKYEFDWTNRFRVMPLFYQGIKPRSCLGPLIVDSR